MKGGLRIAVVGCGSAGPVAALYLHRAGHQVEVFERADALGPVGAGFLLQPTGLDVLAELGLLSRVLELGDPIERLRCVTSRGRTLLNLPYAELGAYYGVGIHRAALLSVLVAALEDAGIPLHLGKHVAALESHDGRYVVHGEAAVLAQSVDLVIVASGGRTHLRDALAPRLRVRPYPWGALWLIGEDTDNQFSGELHQVVRGARHMVGMLPTGRAHDDGRDLVSLFWSLPVAAHERIRERGFGALRDDILAMVPTAEPLLSGIDSVDAFTLAPYVDVVMRPWHRDQVVFIGDAAHATSPQLGQGVNLALCDARALARSFDAEASVADALRRYAGSRRHHLRYYQWASRWLTPFFQSSSRLLGFVRDLAFPVMNWIGPLRRTMTRTMLGTKRGLLRRSLPPPRELPPAADIS